jgi:uroporphyrinogen decarboxylase
MRKPDFGNLLSILRRQRPANGAPVLFEFFLNGPFYEKLTGKTLGVEGRDWTWGAVNPVVIEAFKVAGYDYVTVMGSEMKFETTAIEKKATISLNAGSAIRDRESFESYNWPDPDAFDYSGLETAVNLLPAGMMLIVYGPCGVLENVISLVGFERLCLLLVDDPTLVRDLFDAVGQRLVRYYEICASFDTVGALISNDDWGFKTSTMLSPADLRRYVFPWHKEIVKAIHSAGKPAILHCCGNLEQVMDDIIDDLGYDAKHSFEDVIIPVEEAYEKWGSRIAILGGIDIDFICRSTPGQVEQRCKAMLARTDKKGGYALGTGNSVPEYVPYENYLAMINCVRGT